MTTQQTIHLNATNKKPLLKLQNQQNKVLKTQQTMHVMQQTKKQLLELQNQQTERDKDNHDMHEDYITHVLFIIHLKWL